MRMTVACTVEASHKSCSRAVATLIPTHHTVSKSVATARLHDLWEASTEWVATVPHTACSCPTKTSTPHIRSTTAHLILSQALHAVLHHIASQSNACEHPLLYPVSL